MNSPTADQSAASAAWRRPMDPDRVAGALRRPGVWQVRHVVSTRSTNDDLARGPVPVPDGTVLVTEEQTAGKGRSGRHWSCPAGAGLMFSVRISTASIPAQRQAWVGVALGIAVVRGFRVVAGVDAKLKWPNDVLVAGAKCGGILAESVGESVVVGAGLNISLERSELPREDAMSLLLAGVPVVDRNALLAAILDEFADLMDSWRAAGGDVDGGDEIQASDIQGSDIQGSDIQSRGLRGAYLDHLATLGVSVRVELPGDRHVTGTAVDVDASGAIVLSDARGELSRYSAGDVVHLRPDAAVSDKGDAHDHGRT